MIDLQDGFESSHLVESWLLNAIKLGLDIKCLFESKICTSSVNRDTLNYIEQYPDFHSDTKTMTVRYEGCIYSLIYDDQAYNTVFGEIIGIYDPKEKL